MVDQTSLKEKKNKRHRYSVENVMKHWNIKDIEILFELSSQKK